ncbi:MAG TPA: T9SS type A sorting domain-containing protein [Bacteroidia bacterium]|jgi:uncharacterized delta-60 repeat protein|nr:T9SS type A sorting domain-containing protein [Bacteroidia bacterium]
MKKTNNTPTVKNKFVFIFLMSYFSFCTYAQRGTNDSTFNTPDSGENSILKGPDSRITLSAIQLSNNKIIIAGDFMNYNGSSANHIARLNVNGNIDNTFNMGTGFNNAPSSLVIQSDNKILVGGAFSDYNGLPVQFFIRLNANGNIDNTFKMGAGFNGPIASIAMQADGKILVGGFFSNYNGTSNNGLVRLNKNGTIDASFNATDTSYTNISKIAVDAYGKIIIAYNNCALRKLNANGTVDNSFSNHVYSPINVMNINAMAVQNDGKIIIGGGAEGFSINGVSGILKRFNSNGTEDATFKEQNMFRSIIYSLNIQSDEKIIVAGSQNIVPDDHISSNYISRLYPDGTVDSNFLQINKTTQRVNATYTSTIQPDGKIIVGGFFKEVNTCTANNLVRLNTDGSLDHTLNKTTGANGTIRVSAIQKNGKIIIGGNFYAYQYKSRNHIARLAKNGTIDNSFDPGTGLNGPVYGVAVQTDGKILIGGDFTSYNSTAVKNFIRVNADGTLDNSFQIGSGTDGIVNVITIQSDGKIIVGGSFQKINGVTSPSIVRLNSNGTIDNSFAPFPLNGGSVYSILPLTSGKIMIGGSFLFIDDGIYYMGLIRLNSNGDLDRSLKPLANNETIYSIALQPDGKLIIGGGKRATQYNYYGVAYRLNLDGSIDSTFKRTLTWGNPDNAPFVQTVSYLKNNKILVGGRFTKYDNKNVNRIVLLDNDGTVDSTFVGNANGDVWATQVVKDEKVIVAGGFTNYNGTTRNRITRILFTTPACYTLKSTTQNSYPVLHRESEMNISVYPNPSLSTITIDKLDAGGDLIITDASGGMIYHAFVTNSNIEIDVNEYVSGIYFAIYKVKGKTHTEKLIVNK